METKRQSKLMVGTEIFQVQTPYEIPTDQVMISENMTAIKHGLFVAWKEERELWLFRLYLIHHKINPDSKNFEKMGDFFSADIGSWYEPYFNSEDESYQSISGLLIHIPASKIGIQDNEILARCFETIYTETITFIITLDRVERLCFK